MSDDAEDNGGQDASSASPHDDAEDTGLVQEPILPTEVPGTGDSSVDEALRRLTELDDTDVTAHDNIYGDIQHRLAAVLDDGPGAPPPER